MSVAYGGYELRSLSRELGNGRFSVGVGISRVVDGDRRSATFQDSENQAMLLRSEAEHESIALGKRLVDRALVGF